MLVIAVVDAITCLLAGFAIFSILGNLAENQGKDVGDVIQQGLCIYVSISRSFYNFLKLLEYLKLVCLLETCCLCVKIIKNSWKTGSYNEFCPQF